MSLKFFDAHTHANLAAFKDDHKEVVGRALSLGVGMVNVGVDKDTSLRAVEIAHEFENEQVFAVIGLHPTDADEGTLDYEYYRNLALDPKVVAIGECGLDYFRLEGNVEEKKRKQKEILLEQMKLSKDVEKPLMIHCRSAFPDLIEILDSKPQILNSPPGIIHFFSGTKEEAERLVRLGFYFTFGGVITFVRDYDEVIRSIPTERILSETDAPFVAPVPYRGKRNEPAYVIEVAKKLAEIRGISIKEMSERIIENAKKVFKI
jgi:TatD DNase family protein